MFKFISYDSDTCRGKIRFEYQGREWETETRPFIGDLGLCECTGVTDDPLTSDKIRWPSLPVILTDEEKESFLYMVIKNVAPQFFRCEKCLVPLYPLDPKDFEVKDRPCCNVELNFKYKYGLNEGDLSILGPYYYCMGFLFTKNNNPLNSMDLTDSEKTEFLRSIEESRIKMLIDCKGCWAHDEVLIHLETKQLKKCPDDILSLEDELKNCDKDSPDFEYLNREVPIQKEAFKALHGL
jgi:hypothetical protein